MSKPKGTVSKKIKAKIETAYKLVFSKIKQNVDNAESGCKKFK